MSEQFPLGQFPLGQFPLGQFPLNYVQRVKTLRHERACLREYDGIELVIVIRHSDTT
jgi:hypothetical protein